MTETGSDSDSKTETETETVNSRPPPEGGVTDDLLETNGEPGGSPPTLLVPVAILEGETVPEALVDLVAPLSVIVLGYYVLPEQTAPGQAQMQYEEEADAALTEVASAFADAGAGVETRLVFTHDAERTVTRVADDEDCDAVLVPGTLVVDSVRSILLPKRGPVAMERVVSVLAALVRGTDVTLTLFHAADGQAAAEDGELMLRGAADMLEDAGVDPDRIATRVVVTDAPVAAVVEATREHDLVIVGESEPTLASIVFGEVHERVAAGADRPVLVVRREEHEGDAVDHSVEPTESEADDSGK